MSVRDSEVSRSISTKIPEVMRSREDSNEAQGYKDVISFHLIGHGWHVPLSLDREACGDPSCSQLDDFNRDSSKPSNVAERFL